jgi:hypothetical protein
MDNIETSLNKRMDDLYGVTKASLVAIVITLLSVVLARFV